MKALEISLGWLVSSALVYKYVPYGWKNYTRSRKTCFQRKNRVFFTYLCNTGNSSLKENKRSYRSFSPPVFFQPTGYIFLLFCSVIDFVLNLGWHLCYCCMWNTESESMVWPTTTFNLLSAIQTYSNDDISFISVYFSHHLYC